MKDVIPSTDRELVDLLANLGTHLAGAGASFGLSAGDAAGVASDATSLRALVLDQEDKANSARSATTAKNAARRAIVGRTRALIRRIKDHANYTRAVGDQFGIIAGSSRTVSVLDPENEFMRPNLRSRIGAHGEVLIAFTKHGHTGILLYGRRGSETEWMLLSTRLRSPYVDERVNLVAGAPEGRQYRASYLDGDDPVGQLSDTLDVTVPGISFAEIEAPAVTSSAMTKAAA